jgi:hypothetical protein
MYSSESGSVDFTTDSSQSLQLDKNGNIRAYKLHNNATANGGASQQDIRSVGTESDSVSSLTNINSVTAQKHQWLRVGNVVTVSGVIMEIDVTSGSTLTEIVLSPPIGTGNIDAFTIAGTAAIMDDSNKLTTAILIQNDGSGRVKLFWYSVNGGNHASLSYHYTYEISG